MSSPKIKNISLPISENQHYNRPRLIPRRGVGHRHQALGWDAVDAFVQWTTGQRRTAKSCGSDTRCWCQVCGTCPVNDGDKQEFAHREEHEVSRKAIAQGMSVCSPLTCMLVCAFMRYLHTRPRVQRAPGIPCSLCSLGGTTNLQNSGENAPRDRSLTFSCHHPRCGQSSIRGSSDGIRKAAAYWMPRRSLHRAAIRPTRSRGMTSCGCYGRLRLQRQRINRPSTFPAPSPARSPA